MFDLPKIVFIYPKLYGYIKALHLIAVVCWFAGLFYLPRLFVYHSSTTNIVTRNQFKVMENKLFWYIMTQEGVIILILMGFGYKLK
jgi:putative membrane protein